jgi:nitroimidazol reductase NimA-like FMN-containing flavoprotein (pyridoxamine 5'-phosphate oxidase superfamily)
MRRQDREITDSAQIARSFGRLRYVTFGLVMATAPTSCRFHSAIAMAASYPLRLGGVQLDLLRRNPTVCVEFETDVQLVQADKPCAWSALSQRDRLVWRVWSKTRRPKPGH